jgi:excisionase family DNA binding protein
LHGRVNLLNEVMINGSEAMMTTREVAQLLKVHINTVRRWGNSGILKAYRVGPRGDRRFKKEDINTFVNGNK